MKMKKDKRKVVFILLVFFAYLVVLYFLSLHKSVTITTSPTTTVSTTTTTVATTVSSTTTTVQGITIISPKNMVYNDGKITVSIKADDISNWIGESVDNGTIVKECYSCLSFERYDMSFPIGKHTLTAYVEDSGGNLKTATVEFTVSS